jgi:competence protein ComEC
VRVLADCLRTNLLICFTTAFAGGIFLHESGAIANTIPVLPVVFLLILALATACWWKKSNPAAMVALLGCALVLGCLRTQQQWIWLEHRNAGLPEATTAGTEVLLSGHLAELVRSDGVTSRATIDVDHIGRADGACLAAAHGQILLSVKGAWPTALQPGDALVARTQLRIPLAPNTPGTFDYQDYLARRGIAIVGTVDSPLFLQPLTNSVVQPHRPLHYRIERTRHAIGSRLDASLDPLPAALYRALLIGDRSAIPEPVLESFRGAGVMHILAISGLHVGLLGFFLYSVIYWLLRRSTGLMLRFEVKKAAMVLCIPLLFLYTLLAGSQPPVVRSFIMAVFVIAALASERIKSPFTAVAGAALTILLIDPFALISPSFQLSFAAVGSIILITPRFLQIPPQARSPQARQPLPWRRWLFGLIVVSVAASLGTAPLLLYHFNRVSTVTVAANLAVEPLICLWAMVFGFLALPILPLLPELAAILLEIGAWALSATVAASSFFSSLPLSTIWLPSPPIGAVLLYLAALAMVAAPGPKPAQRWAATCVIGLCLAVMVEPLSGLSASFRKQDLVSVIDVGHGSAVLAELRGGRNILFDGGCRSSPGFDCGASIVAPYLWRRGVARLDDIVISHADADHYNGIPALLLRFGADRLWLPYLDESKSGFARLCRMAEEMGVELRFPNGGPFLQEAGYRLSALGAADGPPEKRRWHTAPEATEDDNSLVVLLETSGFSMILPGDIGTSRERHLVQTTRFLGANILLAAHHGSSTSNSPEFLTRVNPDHLIVSTGDRQGALFPSAALREFVDRHQIRLLTTEAHGTIRIVGTSTGYRIDSYRAGSWSPKSPFTAKRPSDLGEIGRWLSQELEKF